MEITLEEEPQRASRRSVTFDAPDDESPQRVPLQRMRSDSAQLLEALKRLLKRPSFTEKLGVRVEPIDGLSPHPSTSTVWRGQQPPAYAAVPAPPPPSPAVQHANAVDWRTVRRRTFYVVIACSVLILASCVRYILDLEAERRLEEQAIRHAFEHSVRRHADKVAIAVLAGLMAANLILAVRGIAIWNMLSDLKIEAWIQRVAPHMPAAEGTAKTIGFVTLPLRKAVKLALRPLRSASRAHVAARRAAAAEQLQRDQSQAMVSAAAAAVSKAKPLASMAIGAAGRGLLTAAASAAARTCAVALAKGGWWLLPTGAWGWWWLRLMRKSLAPLLPASANTTF